MKTILNKALYKIILFTSCLYGYVAHATGPPCSPHCPPPPDVAPIDTSIIVLIFIAVSFGIYIIHNNKLNKKRPI